MPIAFVDRARLPPADGGADHLLHRGHAQAAARDFRFVWGDLQHRQAGDLFDPDVGGARNAAQDAGDLVGRLQQRIELVAEHLNRDIAAHACEQLIEAHPDRLREFIGVAGQRLHRTFDLRHQLVLGQMRVRPRLSRL